MQKVSSSVLEKEAERLRAAFNPLKYKRGLTQADVAIACGWKSASTFNRLLFAKQALTEASLELVCKVLEVEPITISPRLVQNVQSETVILRKLSVYSATPDDGLKWSAKHATEFMLTHYTIDPGAIALILAGENTPAEFEAWVLLFEQEARPSPGDWVMYDLPAGATSIAKVFNIEKSGGVGVIRPDGSKALLAPSRLLTLTALVRRASMWVQDSEDDADSENPKHKSTTQIPRMRGVSRNVVASK